MIKGRSARLLLRVDQDKLRTTGTSFVIEKSVCLFDPVRIYVRNVNQVSCIPREKALRPLIIFQCPLPENCKRNCQKSECDDPWLQKSVHLTSASAGRKALQRDASSHSTNAQ